LAGSEGRGGARDGALDRQDRQRNRRAEHEAGQEPVEKVIAEVDSELLAEDLLAAQREDPLDRREDRREDRKPHGEPARSEKEDEEVSVGFCGHSRRPLDPRGPNFPLGRLEGRLMCPACGNRRVAVVFEPPRPNGVAYSHKALVDI
jgi:hypothetical protein